MAQQIEGADWHSSSFSSGGSGNCVEVARNLPGVVYVRDTKDKGQGPFHRFTHEEWDAFLKGVRNGEFDIA
ncbi:DUF397 domain-containing protein [Actinoplanes sp. NPDC051411]|uniref:DUF397 domain-containing protein n=1 Tax=Actinoplanes sp. NPDC051411 TaxID=3155522 RepID=UPI00341D47FB